MATTLYKVHRASAGAVPLSAAPAPSGGTYFVGYGADTALARIDSAGTIVWQKDIALTDMVMQGARVLSTPSHVALVITGEDQISFNIAISVLLYDSAGTLVWHKSYILWGDPAYGIAYAIDPADNAVYLTGLVDATEPQLIKLSGSTGDVSWTVPYRAVDELEYEEIYGPIQLLAGGDLIVYSKGPVHTDGSARAYLQRRSKTDGSVTWTRRIAWPVSGSTPYGLAVDASDNIYAYGPQFFNPTYAQLPVVKFDSSGTTLWNKQLQVPASLQARDLRFSWTARGFAGTDGVLIPTNFWLDDVSGKYRGGFVNVPAAGTNGTGNVPLITFDSSANTNYLTPATYGGVGEAFLGVYYDPTTPYSSAIVISGGISGAEDGSFGPYTRTTFAYNLENGTATINTATLTYVTPLTVTSATPKTVTTGAGTLTTTTYAAAPPAQSGTATGIASTLGFGLPFIVGLTYPYSVTTSFGACSLLRGQPATGVEPAVAFGAVLARATYPTASTLSTIAFGVPSVNLNLSYQVTSLGAATQFGDTWAWRETPAAPFTVSGIPSTLAFGTPQRNDVVAALCEGFATTTFGDSRVRSVQPATGVASSVVLGTATLRLPRRAEGSTSTLFGTPQIGVRGNAAGMAAHVLWGVPRVSDDAFGEGVGTSTTVFGTPVVIGSRQRARSGAFYARFGNSRCERTAA